ncbi:MAG: helix-turn-helix transcriptional regulator [Proteobacteria bacterium]|nr:helix-turn-helix transcriptional regulator [Pseudomonadota bacterium]
MSKKKNIEAHHVDIHVGNKLRERRLEMGITQEELAKFVDLTFQQIQKYEKGLNRISCSKLYDFARFLKTDVRYFFQDLESRSSSYHQESMISPTLHDSAYTKSYQHDQGISDIYSEITDLIKAFRNIKDQRVRGNIIGLAQALIKSYTQNNN